ncbi:hypothetical protein C7S10_07725 [Nocardioides currus]|uniref:DUF3558 domain-containing protein n=1 Tax=Nocardioides currus TaxID=2133958 RepID=A0A2R7YZY8_9ACTN|nr:hypothetical protein C7S10_07725 [Nocardioides currus]
MLSGCSGDNPEPERSTGVDPEWYDALDAAVEDAGEVGDIPTLRSDDCPLDTPAVAGEELDGDTDVGVSTLGDSGHRLVCRWSPPATDLVLTRFDDPAELELARDEVGEPGEQDNGDNVETTETITVGDRDLVVRRTVYPTNDSHIDYAAWYFDDESAGLVLLDVETTETRGLIESYDAQQAAEDLAALLDG